MVNGTFESRNKQGRGTELILTRLAKTYFRRLPY